MQLVERIEALYGKAPLEWGSNIQAGEEELPLLRLPAGTFEFSTEVGLWPHFKIVDEQMVLGLNSYRLADGPGQGWAIPCYYEPASEAEAVRKELGFDEGWEGSVPESVLLCGPEWQPFFSQVRRHGRLCVTVEGTGTAYPMRFFPWQLERMPGQTAEC
ncbi:MAG: hypothetical protein AB7S38_42280 [Vulcanimicrobiota bacterium]